MTQFTSFVAVEEVVVTEGGQPGHRGPRRDARSVSYEGVFGEQKSYDMAKMAVAPSASPAAASRRRHRRHHRRARATAHLRLLLGGWK